MDCELIEVGELLSNQNRKFKALKKLLNAPHKITALIFFWFVCSASLFAQPSKEKQLLNALKKEKNEVRQFEKMLSLGEYYQQYNIRLADSIHHILLQKSRTLSDEMRFSALMFSAEIKELIGNQDEYFKDVLACESMQSKLSSEKVQYKLYKHLGKYYTFKKEYAKSSSYLRDALQIGKAKRNYARIAEINNCLALNFIQQNLKDSALYSTDQAIKFARRSANKGILAESFNTQARVYDYFGQLELSVAKNLIALQLATDANELYLQAKYNREIGRSQRSILNLDDAEFYFKKSYEFSRRISDGRQMGLALIDLGTVYFERKDFDLAISETQKAIKVLTNYKDSDGLGEAHNSLGTIYRERKQYNLAASNFNLALVYYESTGNKEKIAAVYHNVGTIFQKQKKYKNALRYLEKSIAIRKAFGSKSQIYTTYRVMSNVYHDIGQPNESLKYLQYYLNYIDSNTTIQASTKIAELSELYRSEQRERLISSQSDSIQRQLQEKALTATKLENSQLRNNFQLYIILGFILIIFLAGIIGFYRWNQTKIRQQQKEAEMSQTLLRAQMNPHFVFNAMSVIQSYIYENDTVNSAKFLVNFSRLMRLILENSPKEFIPLDTEVEILQKYLETQKLRFEDRFDFSIEVADGILTEYASIPPMITQPFIENAIEHGQLHTIEGGFIRVHFDKVGQMLQISIIDNGIGRKGAEMNKKSKDHKSMAMSITKERIDNLNKKYRTEGSMLVEDYDKKRKTGTKVLISLPYKEEHPKTT